MKHRLVGNQRAGDEFSPVCACGHVGPFVPYAIDMLAYQFRLELRRALRPHVREANASEFLVDHPGD